MRIQNCNYCTAHVQKVPGKRREEERLELAIPSMANSAAEKARKTAEKYSGAGKSFHVKYLGTQEVSSAKGDAEIADCLKELRTLFREVAAHLPKVIITLQLSGITVIDDKSKLESIKVPLDQVSYVCLDPGDSSVFSFIIRCHDTISSKGLRLHAFVCHPQMAITFNRSARELFDFMARMMRAKKKMAQQKAQAAASESVDPMEPSVAQQGPGTVPALAPPPPMVKTLPQPLIQQAAGSTGLSDEEERQQVVFDEWKELEKELDDIGKDLGIDTSLQKPITSTPTSSPPTIGPSILLVDTPPVAPIQVHPNVMTTSGSDPFGSSFFDLSFGSTQPPTTSATTTTADIIAGTSADSHLFDNPLFNGYSDTTESMSKLEMAALFTSTPESKQVTYLSRPRPKGKVIDSTAPVSPLSSPVATDKGNARTFRDLSLSPSGEEEVKSILANTDPFSPVPIDPFRSPPTSSMNGSGVFQPAPHTPNKYSSFFSPSSLSTQDSIQLINPLYQSYSPGGSYTAVPFSPPLPMMQYPRAVPQQPLIQQQPVPMTNHPPGVIGLPMSLVSANSFDGVFSPPPTGLPAQSPSVQVALNEQRDRMFVDLLPSGSHEISEKRKEFEPRAKKVAAPTLAQLQETKRKEEEEAFTNSAEKSLGEMTDWPQSPLFDNDVQTHPTSSNFSEPLVSLGSSSTASLPAGDPSESTRPQQKTTDAQVVTLDEFDAAFQEAGSQERDIESAFEVKNVPKPLGTNDPFSPNNGSVTSPEPKSAVPWSTF